MNKPYRGSPILCVRLPEWQINGLKLIARKEKSTTSDLIRDMVAAILHENGITERGMKVIDGQIRLDV